MKFKKGDTHTMWVVISAVIAIILLLVIILFFTGNLNKLVNPIKNFISGLTGQLDETKIKDIINPD